MTGDAVNVAARLQQAAAPGEILIGERHAALARDAIAVEELAPLELKGKAEPVAAYRLIAVEADAPGVARRHDAPMVGRGHELGLLGAAFEGALAAARLRAVHAARRRRGREVAAGARVPGRGRRRAWSRAAASPTARGSPTGR